MKRINRVIFLIIFYYPLSLASQSFLGLSEVLATDGTGNWQFGYSVAIDGSKAISGSPSSNSSRGSVYLFELIGQNWIETKFTASDGNPNDNYGYSVDISNNRFIVGARASSGSGCAYIYEFDGINWIENKITPSDGVLGDNFGLSVAIDGDIAVVGAWNKKNNSIPLPNAQIGAIYIYRWNGSSWIETKKLASDGSAGDYFGFTVDISANKIIASAPGWESTNNLTDNVGKIYVFEYNGVVWNESAHLTASDGSLSDQLGFTNKICIDGNIVVVGSQYDDINGINDAGSVYTFYWTGLNWVEHKILPPSISTNGRFGASVSFKNNNLIVGKPFIPNQNSHGMCYIYSNSGFGWVLMDQFTPNASNTNDFLGFSVDTNGSNIILGAPGSNDQGSNSGSIYLNEISCNENIQTNVIIENSNLYIKDNCSGLILKSPNGVCYKISITDYGNLEFVQISCP